VKIAVFEPYPCTGYNMPLTKYWEGAENTHGGRVIDTIKYWVNKLAPEYNGRLNIYLLPRNATALNWAKENEDDVEFIAKMIVKLNKELKKGVVK